MSLGVVNQRVEFTDNAIISFHETKPQISEFAKWEDFPPSKIGHHGTACCETAREWLFAMDYSNLCGSSILTGPRWIRQRYEWGPTKWMIHWCEAVGQKALDCGAQANLAHEVFLNRGVKSFPVQLVQQYTSEATSQWIKRWESEDASRHWIENDLIYHEGCAILMDDNKIKVWDASAGWWINPLQNGGYGSLIALRLFSGNLHDPVAFEWGKHLIIPNQWQKVV